MNPSILFVRFTNRPLFCKFNILQFFQLTLMKVMRKAADGSFSCIKLNPLKPSGSPTRKCKSVGTDRKTDFVGCDFARETF